MNRSIPSGINYRSKEANFRICKEYGDIIIRLDVKHARLFRFVIHTSGAYIDLFGGINPELNLDTSADAHPIILPEPDVV
jgi:hypothetical protein